jgi:hypothetical protein
MPSSQKALNEARLLHAAFLTTIFLFVFVVHLAAIGERPVSLSLVAGIGCAAVADIGVGFMLRKQYMNKAEQALQVEFDARKALAAWRLANILSFCSCRNRDAVWRSAEIPGGQLEDRRPVFLYRFRAPAAVDAAAWTCRPPPARHLRPLRENRRVKIRSPIGRSAVLHSASRRTFPLGL